MYYFRKTWYSPLLFLLFSCSFILVLLCFLLFFFFFIFLAVIALLLVRPFWGDAKYAGPTGGKKGQNKERNCLWAEKFPLVFYPICLCINCRAFSLFRRPALFMTQPQTHTHSLTHKRTHTHMAAALLTPTLSPECDAKLRSSLTFAFPHKLKLDEREAAEEEEKERGKTAAAALKWREVSH